PSVTSLGPATARVHRGSARADRPPLEHDAALDHRPDARERIEVLRRIAVDEQQIGALALGDHPEVGLLAVGEESRRVEGGGPDRLRGRQARLGQQVQLAVEPRAREDARLHVAAGEDGDAGLVQAVHVVPPGLALRAHLLEVRPEEPEVVAGRNVIEGGEDVCRRRLALERRRRASSTTAASTSPPMRGAWSGRWSTPSLITSAPLPTTSSTARRASSGVSTCIARRGIRYQRSHQGASWRRTGTG